MKTAYLILGIFFTSLGLVGVFIPLLPTTPFVILAAFFFERGSPKFHNWLLQHKYLGPPLKDWQKYRRIRRKFKVLAVAMILISVSFPLSKPEMALHLKGIIVFVVTGVIAFIVTRNEEEKEAE